MSIPALMYNSKSTEVDSVIRLCINAFKKGDWSGDSNLIKLFSDLEEISRDLSGTILQLKAKSSLDKRDHERDKYFRKLHTLVKGYTCHTDETVISAAEKVFAVLDKMGLAVTSKSYTIESSEVVALLKELESLRDEINMLSAVKERIAILERSNNTFMEEQLAFKEEKARSEQKLTATPLKKSALDQFNKKIIPYLNGMVIVNGALYEEFANTLATLVNDSNIVVKKRSSRS